MAALIAQARRIASSSAAGLAREELRKVCLEPAEERAIGDERRLHDLREAGPQLAVRQRRERVRVGDHRRRLVEGADQVLAARVVHPGLAADRGVDHREQRRRQLHDRDAALVRGCRESRDVADHAAAEREHHAVPVEARGDQRVDDDRDVAEGLLLLAAGQHAGLEGPADESLLEPRHPQRPDHVVGHDEELLRARMPRKELRRAEQPRARDDRVGALAELDLELLHHSGPRARAISPATADAGRPSVRMVIAAMER
jgi:hypothetical protein